MTSTEQLQLEEGEKTTFKNIKSLIQNGASMELISKCFRLSVQKIEEIIKKIKLHITKAN